MANRVEATIVVDAPVISQPDEPVLVGANGRVCVMFLEPEIYLHGSVDSLREFARQIAAKVGG